MKLFKYAVFAVLLLQTGFLNKNVQAFEVEGSRRVPIQVPRDVNLRDAQPVRVRIVAVEEAYEEKQHRVGNTQCYYEKRVVETTDNRGFLTKLINPSRGGPVYENQYNCYNQPTTATMRVEVGYIVTYQRFGRHYQKFMYNRPYGKYITIMSNQG